MATINFDVKKGYTFKRNATWRSKKTKLPVNLTGSTIFGQIKKGTITVPFDIVMVAAAEGKFYFRLAPSVTTTLMASTYEMTLSVVDSIGDTTLILEGTMKVLA